MRVVCFMPPAGHALDDNFEFSVRKIAMSVFPLFCAQLAAPAHTSGPPIHGRWSPTGGCAHEDAPSSTTSGLWPRRPGCPEPPMPSATASHAVMPLKTLTKTAWRVTQDDVQPVHDLGAGAAPDVEEVGPAGHHRCAQEGDDVEGGHDQAGTVADDADIPVELDQPRLLGVRQEWSAPTRAWSGWWSALASREHLPSRATMSPSSVLTSGLTSNGGRLHPDRRPRASSRTAY